jgi:hypothetical protein
MPFSLIGTLGLDTSPYEAALSKAERAALQSRAKMITGQRSDSMDPFLANASQWGNSAASAGASHGAAYRNGFMSKVAGMFRGGALLGGAAVLIAGAAAIAKQSINEGGAIQDQTDRSNVSPEKLQKWDLAAKQSGATLSDVVGTFTKMGPKIQEAIDNPLSDAAESFKSFGLGIEDLKSLSMEEIFETLAGRIGKSTVNAKLLTDIMQTMGKGGANLIPTFKTGLDGLNAFINSKEEIASLDQMGDMMTRGGERAKGMARSATAFVTRLANPFVSTLLGEGWHGAPKPALSDEEKEAMLRTSEPEETGKQKKAREAAEAKAAADAAKKEEETQQRIAQIKEQSNKQFEANQLAAMTAEERILFLTEKRAKLIEDLNKIGTFSREEMANKALEINRLTGQIGAAGMNKVAVDAARPESRLDSLARVGGFSGSADQGMRAEFVKQTVLLEAIKRNTNVMSRDVL